MNLIIHRGADQIGGCITEISTENCKILIDFGSNLPGCKKEELTEEQVKSIIGNADAVFYTHYHSDHVYRIRHHYDNVYRIRHQHFL